jgi:hypothetical protein
MSSLFADSSRGLNVVETVVPSSNPRVVCAFRLIKSNPETAVNRDLCIQ